MSKRAGKPPVVTRETARDKIVSTLYGNKEAVKRCECCGKVKLLVEFYRAAKRDSKTCNDTRDKCIVCWDEESRRNRLNKKERSNCDGNSLPINIVEPDCSIDVAQNANSTKIAGAILPI
jgi:hypothetical protein